ncbi:hypothetical protein SY88_23305 [Clostridiales bacterium PH28_bin88]|nr:hypothetical protein SY88_23305 [Clostridiales bacterium PH28_bin88]
MFNNDIITPVKKFFLGERSIPVAKENNRMKTGMLRSFAHVERENLSKIGKDNSVKKGGALISQIRRKNHRKGSGRREK